MKLPAHLGKEDLTFDEVLNPSVLWCKSGHHISEHVRVYSVRGPSLPRHLWGQYCDLCITGAHKLAKRRKESKQELEFQVPPSSFFIDPKAVKISLLRAGFTGGINEKEEQPEKEPWELFLEEIG